MAGIPIVMESFDVDDPSDHDGPIDADPAPIDFNYPHMRPENGVDNLGGAGAGSLAGGPWVTDANGQVRVTLDIVAPQPGKSRLVLMRWQSFYETKLRRTVLRTGRLSTKQETASRFLLTPPPNSSSTSPV